MRYQPLAALLLLLFQATPSVQRRGGGGGGGGGYDDDYDDDNDDSSDNDDYTGGGGDTGSDLPDHSAPCGWWPRQETFGIPGLYYNGTLTIRHNLTDNTAWDDETGKLMECDNDDRSPKTYEYPAMILIAPTGNVSDTNPMHWVLRGFQPAHLQHYRRDEVDLLQRWVYIRSSDFVIVNQTVIWDSPFDPFRTDYLAEADATRMEQTTRVYWETNVTSEDGKVFSAQAEYSQTPPFLDPDDDAYRNMASWDAGLYTSQFVTLSDVCAYNQVMLDKLSYDNKIETVHDAAGNRRRRQVDDVWEAVEPTVWLPTGSTVEMEGIGADSMRWTLESTLSNVIPWKSNREGGSCTRLKSTPFEFSDFAPYESLNNEEPYAVPWNISLNLIMSFEGSIISENSTTLDGERGGKLMFGENYDRFIEKPEESKDNAAMPVRRPTWIFLVAAILCFVI